MTNSQEQPDTVPQTGAAAPGAMKTAIIWTAAATQRQPGPGGFAATVAVEDQPLVRKHGGRRMTTHERMEIFAAIAGLSALEDPCNIELRASNEVVVRVVNARSLNDHPDLSPHLLPLLEKHNAVAILQIKRADPEHQETYGWALKACQSSPQKPDTGYEQRQPPQEAA